MHEQPNHKIRDATIDDVETIVRFNAALAKESEDLSPDIPTLREGVKALFDDPTKGRYFIAETQGRVVGQVLITYEWSDWRNGTYIWLQSVYVDPGQRRKGVFRSLYRHVEQIASGPGTCGLRLYVHRGNESALATYERMGMRSGEYLVLETPDPLRSGQGGEGAPREVS